MLLDLIRNVPMAVGPSTFPLPELPTLIMHSICAASPTSCPGPAVDDDSSDDDFVDELLSGLATGVPRLNTVLLQTS